MKQTKCTVMMSGRVKSRAVASGSCFFDKHAPKELWTYVALTREE